MSCIAYFSRPSSLKMKLTITRCRSSYLLIFSLACLVYTACHTPRKITALPANSVQIVSCAEEYLLAADQVHPMFKEINATDAQFPSSFPLPKKYTVYEVPADTLIRFFALLPGRGDKKPLMLVLPLPTGCMPFAVRAKETKEGSLSVTGSGTREKNYHLELTWDGKQMNGQVDVSGNVAYYIQSVANGDQLFYVIYDKNDMAVEPTRVKSSPTAPQQMTSPINADR